jgi:hypothetical protein
MICNGPIGYPVPFIGRPYPLQEKGEIPWEACIFMGHHDERHVIPEPTKDGVGSVLNVLA